MCDVFKCPNETDGPKVQWTGGLVSTICKKCFVEQLMFGTVAVYVDNEGNEIELVRRKKNKLPEITKPRKEHFAMEERMLMEEHKAKQKKHPPCVICGGENDIADICKKCAKEYFELPVL